MHSSPTTLGSTTLAVVFSCLLGAPKGVDHFLQHKASSQDVAYIDVFDASQLDIYNLAALALRADLGVAAAAAVVPS